MLPAARFILRRRLGDVGLMLALGLPFSVRFVNPGAGDVELQPGSRARRAGEHGDELGARQQNLPESATP